MIVYRLKCQEGHEFDAWFRDSKAYDGQADAGLIACAVCGGHDVKKAPMAPNITASRDKARAPAPTPAAAQTTGDGPQKAPSSPAEILDKMHALARSLRDTVESEFEHVGKRFAEEARLIHYGEAEARGIYGEASSNEVRDLVEEGIAVAPLPDPPDKAN